MSNKIYLYRIIKSYKYVYPRRNYRERSAVNVYP